MTALREVMLAGANLGGRASAPAEMTSNLPSPPRWPPGSVEADALARRSRTVSRADRVLSTGARPTDRST
jgi:hypothetical protein